MELLGHWLTRYPIGDLASLIGLVVGIFGFWWTLQNVHRSREAAEAARDAIVRFDALTALSSALTAMEELKELQRSKSWAALPGRYSSLRRDLIRLRESPLSLNDDEWGEIQSSIRALATMEREIDNELEAGGPQRPRFARLNEALSGHLDKLTAILERARRQPPS